MPFSDRAVTVSSSSGRSRRRLERRRHAAQVVEQPAVQREQFERRRSAARRRRCRGAARTTATPLRSSTSPAATYDGHERQQVQGEQVPAAPSSNQARRPKSDSTASVNSSARTASTVLSAMVRVRQASHAAHAHASRMVTCNCRFETDPSGKSWPAVSGRRHPPVQVVEQDQQEQRQQADAAEVERHRDGLVRRGARAGGPRRSGPTNGSASTANGCSTPLTASSNLRAPK